MLQEQHVVGTVLTAVTQSGDKGQPVGLSSKDGKAEARPEHEALAKADWGTL